jgi:Domain of unknown function (DUF6468)
MDAFLAVLLIAALVLGVRLNARLKALKQSHEGFARAIVELNDAAVRAERGLAGLREAATETHDSLLARIETARSLSTRLETQIQIARGMVESQALARTALPGEAKAQIPAAAAPSAPPSGASESQASESLRRLALRFGLSRERESVQPRPPRPARPSRQRLPEEDDLFEPVDSRSPPRPQPIAGRHDEAESVLPLATRAAPARAPLSGEDFAARIRARRDTGGRG